MIGAFSGLPPVLQALIATTFTWGMTACGAALVFGTSNVDRRLLDSMLGFAAGVMIAASFWSLLAPAIELSEGGPLPVWGPLLIGFLAGGAFLRLVDRFLPHRVFGRLELLERIQGEAYAGYERTVDAHVKNLRRKLAAAGGDEAAASIVTMPGVGYKLGEPRA